MEKWRAQEDADISRNTAMGWGRTHRPYLAHLCPVQRGMVVVFLLPAPDDVVNGTKLPATLSPILGHFLLCCEKQHPCSLFKRFVCMPFQCNQQSHPRSLETSDDHLELAAEVPSRVSVYPRSCAVDAPVVLAWFPYSPPPAVARAACVGLHEDPNSDLPQE